MQDNALLIKTKAFALAAIKVVKAVQKHEREYILTKQYLRAATNPGAMAREAQQAESKADFIHKLAIAKKEADEADYWFELLEESDYFVGIDVSSARKLNMEVMRLLTSILRTSRGKGKK